MLTSLKFSLEIFRKIIPTILLIFLIMTLLNRLMRRRTLIKYLKKSSGIKKWSIAVLSGIFSFGPIYIWYPLLKNLRDKGAHYGLIVCFIYAKAIKPALFPLMISYFGLKYVLVLTFFMILASLFSGLIFEILERKKLFKKNRSGILS
jgi:uncharacterized membrane protein YraQ (UPF0718 family)